MRDYGRVPVSFWTGKERAELSDDGCMLLLYVRSSPHCNAIGCFRLPESYIAEDMRWSGERVAKALFETVSKRFLNRCESTFWVQICGFFNDNPIANPNVGKHAAELVAAIPENCTLLPLILKELEQFADRLPLWITNRFETVSKPFRNIEQQQQQEIEIDNNTAASVSGNTRARIVDKPEKELNLNDIMTAELVAAKLAGVRTLTPDDKRVLLRWCKDYDMRSVFDVLEKRLGKYAERHGRPPANPLTYFDAAVKEAAESGGIARKIIK